MVVNPTMESVRPHVFAAIVRGVDQGSSEAQRDRFVQSLMDHQEKSTLTKQFPTTNWGSTELRPNILVSPKKKQVEKIKRSF